MPIYEFACSLGHRREEFRKVAKRDTRLECPECGNPMKRLPSAFAFKMKKKGMDSTKAVKQHLGIKEPTYIVPETQEHVRFKGPKSTWRRQAYNAQVKAKPKLAYKDFHLTNV